MSNKISFAAFFGTLLLVGKIACAGTIVDFDFEAGNDPSQIFAFSQGSQVTITTDLNSANGNAGTEGAEFSVVGQTGTPTFAGGGLGVFDLAVDPQFVAGAITVADLDTLMIDVDLEVAGPAIGPLRIEAGGSFENRVELMPTLSGAFQSYAFDLSGLDDTQKANLAAHMNSTNDTQIRMVFSFAADGAGIYEVGNAVRFDNLRIVSAVPEPAGTMLLGIGAIGLFWRRRRS